MIFESAPRDTIEVNFADGRTFTGPRGATAEDFVTVAQPVTAGTIVAVLLNGRLRELDTPLDTDTELVPVDSSDSDGVRIYRRSLCFLMVVAARELFPGNSISIQHSIPSGGYYCERRGGPPFTDAELAQLQKRMGELVAADLPIVREQVPLQEALQHFETEGAADKVLLFAKRRKDYMTLYRLNGARDYFHGFMVSRTRYLRHFDLCAYGDGFILRFPRRFAPNELQPFQDEARLATVFQTYRRWLEVVDVPNVNVLNTAIGDGRIQEVVLIAEALHRRQITTIAAEIAARRHEIRIVLISGPTSAGKTTFSKRLAVQLLARGIHPVAIAMDNYFVNREDTPLDGAGNYNFEHIEAVDLPLFHDHLRRLLAGETIIQPVFNFRLGRREQGAPLAIRPDQVLLIEGIHALNPSLAGPAATEKNTYRIFISAFTQLNLDRHNRIPTTDTRKLRRIVRDFQYRGHNAAATIRMWPRVRLGERLYIFPFQHHADVFVNSALAYEMAALKSLAQPILLQVEPGTPERVEANRLLAFLQWFDPLPPQVLASIPNDSIIREFVGGSILEHFEPWVD